jgi:hypothetical protein
MDLSSAVKRMGRLKVQIGGLLMDLQELALNRLPKMKFVELFTGERDDLKQPFSYRVAQSELERQKLRRIEEELKKEVSELLDKLKDVENRIRDLQETPPSSQSPTEPENLLSAIDVLLARAVSLRLFEHLPHHDHT